MAGYLKINRQQLLINHLRHSSSKKVTGFSFWNVKYSCIGKPVAIIKTSPKSPKVAEINLSTDLVLATLPARLFVNKWEKWTLIETYSNSHTNMHLGPVMFLGRKKVNLRIETQVRSLAVYAYICMCACLWISPLHNITLSGLAGVCVS